MPNNITFLNKLPIPIQMIERRIYLIRGQKVMLDSDLAELYQVTTSALNQAVRRNLDRFPTDFMFQLTKDEMKIWKSQIVISNPAAKMSVRKTPLVFTEQGISMLSSVLHSKRAIHMNIAIMRAFVKLREAIANHKDLAQKFEALERKFQHHDKDIQIIFQTIKKTHRTSCCA